MADPADTTRALLLRLALAARAYLLDLRRYGNAPVIRSAVDDEFRAALEAAEREVGQ